MVAAQWGAPIGMSKVQVAALGQAEDRAEGAQLKDHGQERYML